MIYLKTQSFSKDVHLKTEVPLAKLKRKRVVKRRRRIDKFRQRHVNKHTVGVWQLIIHRHDEHTKTKAADIHINEQTKRKRYAQTRACQNLFR